MGAAFTQWFRGLVPGHSLLSHSTNTVRPTQPQEMTPATLYYHSQSKVDIVTFRENHHSIYTAYQHT